MIPAIPPTPAQPASQPTAAADATAQKGQDFLSALLGSAAASTSKDPAAGGAAAESETDPANSEAAGDGAMDEQAGVVDPMSADGTETSLPPGVNWVLESLGTIAETGTEVAAEGAATADGQLGADPGGVDPLAGGQAPLSPNPATATGEPGSGKQAVSPNVQSAAGVAAQAQTMPAETGADGDGSAHQRIADAAFVDNAARKVQEAQKSSGKAGEETFMVIADAADAGPESIKVGDPRSNASSGNLLGESVRQVAQGSQLGTELDQRGGDRPPQGQDSLQSTSAPGSSSSTTVDRSSASSFAQSLNAMKQGGPETPASQQVALQIHKAVAEGVDRLTMQLQPERLGGIEISLELSSGGRVSANIVVDRPETLSLLQRDARGLEQALASAGLDANGSDLNFSLRHQEQHAGGSHSQSRGQNQDENDGVITASSEIILDAGRTLRAADGRLDISV